MQALINFGTALISAMIVFGVVTVFPESVNKVKKMTSWGDTSVVVAMWFVLALSAFAAKDIITSGPLTQGIGLLITNLVSSIK